MTKALSAGCALILFLVIIEAVIVTSRSFLPLGNSNIAQIGAILGMCVIFSQIHDITKDYWNDSKK